MGPNGLPWLRIVQLTFIFVNNHREKNMARITVEDCLKKVKNHFELVLIASKRARQIAKGGMALVDPENDKPTVIALREIASGRLNEAEGELDSRSGTQTTEH